MPFLKQYSLRIFIIRGAFGYVYEPAWQEALTNLGHKVYFFDSHKFTSCGILGRLERRYLFGPGILNIRRSSLKLAKEFKPDIILLYQGHYHDDKTVYELSKIAWVTGYHNDNPFSARLDKRHFFRYNHLLKALKYYNSYHVYRDNNIQDFKECGIKHVEVLHSFYIPWIDKPINDFSKKLGADIIFAGHPEKDGREIYINLLLEKGYDIKIYGAKKYWMPLINKQFHDKINDIRVLDKTEYRIALNSSKICLSFFSHWNRDSYTRRVFEIPAMGKFLFTTRTEVMQSLYKEGVEADYFSTKEEFLRKIDFYLSNDIIRNSISRNGYLRCINSGYDIYSKLNDWLNIIEKWRRE